MKTLFELEGEFLSLYSLVDETGELTEELEKQFAALEQDEARKLDNYIGLLAQMDMEESAAKAQVDQWMAKARARANLREQLKARIKAYLEATGRKEVRTATGRVISIKGNGGVLPIVIPEGIDPKSVPEEFQKVVTTIDKNAVALALQKGLALEWATYGERGTHLKIK